MIYLPHPEGGRIPVDPELYWGMIGPYPVVDQGYATFTDWDGCTCSPDRLWLFKWWDLRPACFLHDYHAHLGMDGRNVIGFRFYRNIFRCVRYQGGWWPWAAFVALAYSSIVWPAWQVRKWIRG